MKVRAMAYHGGEAHGEKGQTAIAAAGITFDPDRLYPVTLDYRDDRPLGTARLVRDAREGHIWADLSVEDPPKGFDSVALGLVVDVGAGNGVVTAVAIVERNSDPRVTPFRDPGDRSEILDLAVHMTGTVTDLGDGRRMLAIEGLDGYQVTSKDPDWPTDEQAALFASKWLHEVAARRGSPAPSAEYRIDQGLVFTGPVQRYLVEMDGEPVPHLQVRPIHPDGTDWVPESSEAEPEGWEVGLEGTPIRVGVPTRQVPMIIRLMAHSMARAQGHAGHAVQRVVHNPNAHRTTTLYQVALLDGDSPGATFGCSAETPTEAFGFAVSLLTEHTSATAAAILDTQDGGTVTVTREGDRFGLDEPIPMEGGDALTAAVLRGDEVVLVGHKAGDGTGNESVL